jgi:hypothetical protein
MNPPDAPAKPPRETPNADMQPEDAGTADSGNDNAQSDDEGSRANRAEKQTSKTGSTSTGRDDQR